jgi:hypothetical protein
MQCARNVLRAGREIVALGPDGRSKFYDLMFRREWPHFIAFDVLSNRTRGPAQPAARRAQATPADDHA